MSASRADVLAFFKIVFFADRADAFVEDVFIIVFFNEMDFAFFSKFCFANFAEILFNGDPIEFTTLTLFIFGHKYLGFANFSYIICIWCVDVNCFLQNIYIFYYLIIFIIKNHISRRVWRGFALGETGQKPNRQKDSPKKLGK